MFISSHFFFLFYLCIVVAHSCRSLTYLVRCQICCLVICFWKTRKCLSDSSKLFWRTYLALLLTAHVEVMSSMHETVNYVYLTSRLMQISGTKLGSFWWQATNVPMPPVVPQSEFLPEAPGFTCAICIGQLIEETSTKCGHIFCKKCIEKAIATQHKCPTCRHKLRKRDILRIYLPNSS